MNARIIYCASSLFLLLSVLLIGYSCNAPDRSTMAEEAANVVNKIEETLVGTQNTPASLSSQRHFLYAWLADCVNTTEKFDLKKWAEEYFEKKARKNITTALFY